MVKPILTTAGEQGSAGAHNPSMPGSSPGPATIPPETVEEFPSRETFAAMFPGVKASRQDAYYDAILDTCREFEINTPQRVCAFLAQVAHETAGLVYLEELGGPGYWKRYEQRRDLGNLQHGDGIRYHGRGLIQLTGRHNYGEFGDALDVPLLEHPHLAEVMPTAARIAGLFWKRRGLNELADAGTRDAFRRISQKINGGIVGLADRMKRWDDFRKILGVEVVVEPLRLAALQAKEA